MRSSIRNGQIGLIKRSVQNGFLDGILKVGMLCIAICFVQAYRSFFLPLSAGVGGIWQVLKMILVFGVIALLVVVHVRILRWQARKEVYFQFAFLPNPQASESTDRARRDAYESERMRLDPQDCHPGAWRLYRVAYAAGMTIPLLSSALALGFYKSAVRVWIAVIVLATVSIVALITVNADLRKEGWD